MKVDTEPSDRLRKVRTDALPTGENYAARRAEHNHNRPFIMWDGEGVTNEFGQHRYSLFGNSIGARIERPSLTWKDCIGLLMESPKDAIHVIFAGTYDVVMMFLDTPIIRQLLTEDGSGVGVMYQGYRITFRRGKYLRITDTKRHETRTLYDVFTFFRSSFVASCREYGVGSDELLANVERMKSNRATFSVITDEVREYMAWELDLGVQLCDSLRDRLALCNIYPSQWHGPGAVASAVLRTHKIGACKGVYSDDFRRCAESAYYGGRFEQFKRGTHIGTVYQYDIRSAYPAAMCHLPDLSNVTWTHYTAVDHKQHSDYALYRIECRNDVEAVEIGRIPHRNDLGTIYFPPWVNGWYWGIECRHIPGKYRREVWWPTGEGLTARPFREWVTEAYRQRAVLKKANQPQQLALKLMLNSLYGKLAQSKGAKRDGHGWRYPTFHETVWAGWITAYTRAQINEALHSVPVGHVIATETDSVFTTRPIPNLTIGEGLGEWECQLADGIRYIQSGVSLVLSGDRWLFKTRGFTVKPTTDEVAVWERFIVEGKPITVRQTRFGTDPRQKKFGQWYTMDRQLSLDGSIMEKRVHQPCVACRRGDGFGDALHDMVACPIPFKASVPYMFPWRDDVPSRHEMRVVEESADDPILHMEYLEETGVTK